MPEPLVLVSGFGPFEVFDLNPSGAIALALAERPPPAVRVRARVLPVSFARAPSEFDELLRSGEVPALLLGLGVTRERGFRLERRGGPSLKLVPRPDVDGQFAREFSRPGRRRQTALDLPRMLAGLRARGVTDCRISHSAGGYVCEHVYHHLLVRAAERSTPGLFVHVPPLSFTELARQTEVVSWVIEEALATT